MSLKVAPQSHKHRIHIPPKSPRRHIAVTAGPLTPKDWRGLKRRKKAPHCAYSTCEDPIKDNEIVYRIFDSYAHERCLPKQSVGDLTKEGSKATCKGVLGLMRKHPILTTLGVTAVAGLIAYTCWSAQKFEEVCFKDPQDSTTAWCAERIAGSPMDKLVFNKFERIFDFVPSADFVTKPFREVQEWGSKSFILNKFTRIFSKSIPWSSFKFW